MEWLKTCVNCKHFRRQWAWCAKRKQTREENWDACDKQKELVQKQKSKSQTNPLTNKQTYYNITIKYQNK